jgi:serine/threonine protein kinase/Flp pilus assembly protein TadD
MSERDIFDAAVAIDDFAERAAYLDRVCAGDAGLRQRMEGLLSVDAQVGSFLESPAAALGATADDPISERPGTVIGPYKLMEQIGEGGMGLVFVAEQQQPVRRKVALKVIKPGMDTRQVIARFEAERQALALMDHPNIAKVHDGGTTDSGRPYFVMELVKGVPITEYCDQNQVPIRERLELFVSVCQAVQHAHQKGIIHRDLKPSNVMVMSHDGTPVVKVIDFGVAKAIGQQLTDKTIYTQFSQMVGTPLYMSPEQAGQSGMDADTRSDIYALGVLLYELMTGTTPFERERLREADYDEIRRIIREEEPPRPSTRISTLGQAVTTVSTNRQSDPKQLSRLFRGELDWIVMKCLEKDRNCRYETAIGLARDIERYLHDEPVQACPPSALYRFRKFARRNKVALTMAAIIGLAFLITTGTLGWAVRDRAAREDDAAREQATRQTALKQAIVRALEETENACQRGRFREASAALKRAEERLADGEASEELGERVRQWRADLNLVDRLQEARMLGTHPLINEDLVRYELAIPEYDAALRDYGLDRQRCTPEEAGRRIASQPPEIRLAVIAALEYWIDVEVGRKIGTKRQPDEKKQAWLKAAVRVADNDPWRARMRLAAEQNDTQTLQELAAAPELVRQAPYTLESLGSKLRGKRAGTRDVGLGLLRQAQQLHPDNFWMNIVLGDALRNASSMRDVDGHRVLSVELLNKDAPERQEAIRFYSIAVALRPDSCLAVERLGYALRLAGRLDEQVVAFRRAIELRPGMAGLHRELAQAYNRLGKLNEAIAEYRKTIDLKPNAASAHHNLATPLTAQGKWDEVIAAERKAIELEPNYAWAHIGLGHALVNKGQLDAAIAEYQVAIRCAKDLPEAHCALGLALLQKGQLDQALASLRRGHERGSKIAGWPFAASLHPRDWLLMCEQLVSVADQLPDFLDGKKRPVNAMQGLAVAYLCEAHLHQPGNKKRYAAVARCYADAFTAEPASIRDEPHPFRYNAACLAALAGCGKGEDAKSLSDKERARLRQQALEWLRAELAAWHRRFDREPPEARPGIVQHMKDWQPWQRDPDFAGVRDPHALEQLPLAERSDWQKLWQEVEEFQRVAEPAKPASSGPP